jgi:regulation of enolase protein 1 (concanavalin A-like superfamily)
VTSSTALIDYSITADGGTELSPSQTNDHVSSGAKGFHENGKQGLGVKGMVTGVVDTATGDSGTSIPNGKHLRHMFQVMPQDGVKGYVLAYDEINPYSSYKPGLAFPVNNSWHPAGNTVITVANKQEYKWSIGTSGTKSVFMSVFLGTEPSSTDIYTGPQAPVRAAEYIYNTYPMDAAVRRRQIVTVLYPHYTTGSDATLVDTKASFTRLSGTGYSGASVRSSATVIDYAITTDTGEVSPLSGMTVNGKAAYARLVSDSLSTYSGRSVRKILMSGVGFESSLAVNVTMRNGNGKIDVLGSVNASVTFRQAGFPAIKIDGVTATPTASGSGFVTVSLTPGVHNVEIVAATPSITSPSTANGRVGDAFSYTITATGAPTSYSTPVKPSWLSINTTTGVLSGTPTTAGTYSVTMRATNGAGSDEDSLTIDIAPAVEVLNPPVINSAPDATGRLGVAFGPYSVSATNSPTYNATNLPPGLSINTTTGAITGTPNTVGTFDGTVTATNADGSDSENIIITILPPAPVINVSNQSATAGVAFSYQVAATNSPDFSATGLSPFVISETGLITGTASASGTINATITATNDGGSDSKALTITVAPAPVPVITNATCNVIRGVAISGCTIVASNGPITGYAIDVTTPLPTGLSLTAGAITGSTMAIGSYAITVRATNSFGTSAPSTITIVIAVPAPVISSSLTTSVQVNQPFSYQITASDAASFNVINKPTWLNVNTSTGQLSGTPTTSGSVTATIQAINTTATDSKTLTINVLIPPPVISNTSCNVIRGVALSACGISASNSPTSFAIDASTPLPSPLVLNTSTGAITGTPTTVGTYAITVRATNTTGTSAPGTVTIVVAVPAPVISSSLTTSVQVNQAFSYQITASDAASFNAINKPTWLTVNTSTGQLSGTPTASGSVTATIQAINATATDSKTLTINVTSAPIPVPVVSNVTCNGVQGSVLTSCAISATNSPTSYAVDASTPLPNGLSLSGAQIVGTPSGSGTFAITVRASNATGPSLPATLTLVISAAPVPVISSANTQTGTVGVALSYAIVANNAPTSYSATGLPAWLTLNTTTGVISGTPPVSAANTSFVVTVGAINIGGPGTRAVTFSITSSGAATKPTLSNIANQSGVVGTAFSLQVNASNAPTSYAATGLPTGLSINTSTGLISGTPSAEGTFNASVSATNSAGSDSKNVTFIITPKTGAVPKGWKSPVMPNAQIEMATENGGNWTLKGHSGKAEGKSDSVVGVWREVSGDFTASTCITGMVAAEANASLEPETFGGLMLRASMEPGAMHASAVMTYKQGRGFSFIRRTAANDNTWITAGEKRGMSDSPTVCVRLTRKGDQVQAFSSLDNKVWSPIRKDALSGLPAKVQLGLALSTEGNAANATVSFDKLSVTDSAGVEIPAETAP